MLPNGFDERLKSTSGGRRVLRDIPTALFKEHVAFLAAGVREALGTDGTPSLEARWRGRVFLHKWMVDRLVEQQQQLGQQLGGGHGRGVLKPHLAHFFPFVSPPRGKLRGAEKTKS